NRSAGPKRLVLVHECQLDSAGFDHCRAARSQSIRSGTLPARCHSDHVAAGRDRSFGRRGRRPVTLYADAPAALQPASGNRVRDGIHRFSMNILYATDFHNRANSGITFAVDALAGQACAQLSPKGSVSLLSIGESDVGVREGVHHLTVEPSIGPSRAWRFAPTYASTCETLIKREAISLVHIHGIWMYPQFATARAAQRLGLPTVLTNHGAVQWALRQPGLLGAAKKRLY